MYSKIFRRIYESSIAENPTLRFTFMDLLVLADKDGIVDMTHEAIARITNRPLPEIKETISILESPDPKSRSPEENGARIRRIDSHRDWGWIIVHYDRFHDMAEEEERRMATRERVRRYREKSRNSSIHEQKDLCNADVTPCNNLYGKVTDSSVSVSVSESVQKRGCGGKTDRIPTWEKVELYGAKIGLSKEQCEEFFDHFSSNGWKVSGKTPMVSWEAALRNWLRRHRSGCFKSNAPEKKKGWAEQELESMSRKLEED